MAGILPSPPYSTQRTPIFSSCLVGSKGARWQKAALSHGGVGNQSWQPRTEKRRNKTRDDEDESTRAASSREHEARCARKRYTTLHPAPQSHSPTWAVGPRSPTGLSCNRMYFSNFYLRIYLFCFRFCAHQQNESGVVVCLWNFYKFAV